jgi:hypothetical protein
VSYKTGDRDENAALADDHSLAFGFEVPKIGESQSHKRSRGHARVGALRLSADAVKRSIDHNPVHARIGTSSDGGMADALRELMRQVQNETLSLSDMSARLMGT